MSRVENTAMTTDRLVERFEAKMADPGPDRWLSVGSALGAAAAVYGGAMALRAECYRRGLFTSYRCSCPVVSVGNLTIGGTGKTPMVVYLARRLLAAGKKPTVVSRGYRGVSENAGGIVSDTSRILLPAEAAGDEPWLIASLLKGVPVVVGRDRCRAACIAHRAFSPDVILMDDGFQHLRMRRSLNLLLLDAADPFGNGRIFPRGVLREPISAAARADAIVLTRSSGPEGPLPPGLENIRAIDRKPIFRAVHRPRLRGVAAPGGAFLQEAAGTAAEPLDAKRVFAFSGIARNQSFQQSIRALGGHLAGAKGFSDHHRYPASEQAALERAARRAGADLMATTDKDFARLGGKNPFAMGLAVVGVDLSMVSGRKRLDSLLDDCQNRRRRD